MEVFQNTEFFTKTKKKILSLNNYAWNRKIDWTNVEAWLANFKSADDLGECEKVQMLHILSQFMYFGQREIKELLLCIFRDKYKYNLVKKIRLANNKTLDRGLIDQLFNRELQKTRFLGVGNPSESGTHLLYYFRQLNGLPKNLFIDKEDIFETEHSIRKERDGVPYIEKSQKLTSDLISNYVFIDDMCGSGDQACSYLEKTVNEIKSLNPTATISYYVLFANRAGIENVKAKTSFDNVDCVFELDETFRCFEKESRHFKSTKYPISLEQAKKISFNYGQAIEPRFPLGYSNNQLLIGFNHNTPDNTLPIIWYEEEGMDWQPIFKRYDKKYGWGA